MGVKSNIMGDDFLREMLADDRAYKADKLVERWSKMPEIGEGLVDLPTNKARNTAILLENQARSMAKMTEAHSLLTSRATLLRTSSELLDLLILSLSEVISSQNLP